MKYSFSGIVSIIFTLLYTSQVQGQFSAISPKGGCSSGHIYSVYMKDADNLFLATENCFSKSTDAGDSLFSLSNNGVNTPSDFAWGNADTAYYVNGPSVYYTYDGGNTWDNTFIGQSGLAVDIHAFSGLDFIIAATDGGIYRTTDGGNSYNAINSGTKLNLNSIHFINVNVGFICGDDGVLLKTTNGGNNWSKLNSGTKTLALKYVWFLDSNVGFVCGDSGIIIKTTDGGSNWTQLNSGITTQLNCIKNAGNSSTKWFACGDQGIILKSTDAGNSWADQSVNGVTDILEKIYFTDSTHGFCVGLNHTILKINPCPVANFKLVQSSLCVGSPIDFINLSLGSNNSYSWKINGTEFSKNDQPQYSFNTSGNYIITLYAKSNVKQCDDSIVKNITINDLPAQPVISGLHTYCKTGGNITITSSADSGNQWMDKTGTDIPGENGKQLVVKFLGSYRVRVTSAVGCSSVSDSFNIIQVPTTPVIDFTLSNNSSAINITNSTQHAELNYWYISDKNSTSNYTLISNLANPSPINPSQGLGLYSVKQVAVNGCGSDSAIKTINTNTSLNSALDPAPINIYPNPAKEVLYFVSSGLERYNIVIKDISGKNVLEIFYSNAGMNELSVKNLERGVYIIYIQNERVNQASKFIIE